jgi:hypothetical protein
MVQIRLPSSVGKYVTVGMTDRLCPNRPIITGSPLTSSTTAPRSRTHLLSIGTRAERPTPKTIRKIQDDSNLRAISRRRDGLPKEFN